MPGVRPGGWRRLNGSLMCTTSPPPAIIRDTQLPPDRAMPVIKIGLPTPSPVRNLSMGTGAGVRCQPAGGRIGTLSGLRWGSAQLATAFELGIDLATDQQRERRDPEPRQHDDHRGQAPPRLVVRG